DHGRAHYGATGSGVPDCRKNRCGPRRAGETTWLGLMLLLIKQQQRPSHAAGRRQMGSPAVLINGLPRSMHLVLTFGRDPGAIMHRPAAGTASIHNGHFGRAAARAPAEP